MGNYSTTSGIIEKPADYGDNSLESYIQLKAPETDASDLVSKPEDYGEGDLKNYIQTVGISGGTRFDDQLIKKRMKNIDGFDDQIWEYTLQNGTYTAVDSLRSLKNIVGGIMSSMLDIYGYNIVENNSIYNLNRFNPDFMVGNKMTCRLE